MFPVVWPILKAFVDAKSLSVQWSEDDSFYFLEATEGTTFFNCKISKTSDGDATFKSEFEASYKAAGNARVSPHMGQTTMANSMPVAIASNQSAVPISAASLPLPTGAATSALQTQPGVDIGDVTINNAAGAAAVNIQDGGNSITVDGTVLVNQGNTSTVGSISTLGGGTGRAVTGQNTAYVTLSGTWVGTVTFQGSVDGASYFDIDAMNMSTVPQGILNSTTVNGIYIMPIGGLALIQAKVTAYTSGTVGMRIDVGYGIYPTYSRLIDSSGQQVTIGQKTMANSLPVVLASDQTALSVNQGTANTIGNAWPVKLTDGTDSAIISSNGDINVVDGLTNGGVHGALALTTANTTYEAKVGANRLSNRKALTITAMDDMFWGYDNTVTTSSGTPLYKNQSIIFSIDPDSTFQIWVVASSNTKTARITESP